MRVSNLTKALTVALSVAWAAGCSTTGNNTDGGNAGSTGSGEVSTSGTGIGGGFTTQGSSVSDPTTLQSVFYFDFDKAVLPTSSVAELEKHAQYIMSNSMAKVRIEGHADERGTREYNMALGERRAQAVERFLQVNGASALQMEVISYGEEKPAAIGHNESSWSENRRVELKYVSQ